MVRTASVLGEKWSVPHVVIGMLILATLTGVPNVFAAIRLAIHGRGAAVISESLNSNTINVLAGICLPALIIGLSGVSASAQLAAWWLLAMTVLVVAFTVTAAGCFARAPSSLGSTRVCRSDPVLVTYRGDAGTSPPLRPPRSMRGGLGTSVASALSPHISLDERARFHDDGTQGGLDERE